MYQALYRKYRPQTFDDVVGQKSVTQTLKSQLLQNKLSHAYLFTGSRGTGKTSCAKILAKAVNCLSPIDGNPCNHCAACRAIDQGSCMDVLEIDAASNNGVDNVRSLRDDAIYAPAEVKKRVYIIDEVHMLSISAFNALLKIIEEPPAHLMFILATTELHKVPATILSRCQRFSFRRLTPEDITGRINYVAYEEGIDLEPEAAQLLGRLADGALRDGMSLLDQCATASTGTLTAESVYNILGLAGARRCAELLSAVADRDAKQALAILADQYAAGKDIAAMLDELVGLCRDLLVLKTAPGAGRQMLSGQCTDAELSALLPRFTSAELLRHTQLLQKTASGFKTSTNRRIDAELCLIQLCDPTLELDPVSLNARLTRLEETIATGAFRAVTVQAPAVAEAEARPPLPEEPPVPEQAQPEGEELPMDFWPEFAARVRTELQPSQRGFFVFGEKGMLSGRLRGQELTMLAKTPFIKQMLDKPETKQIMADKASVLLKRPIRVRFDTASAADQQQAKLRQELLSFGRAHSDIVNIHED